NGALAGHLPGTYRISGLGNLPLCRAWPRLVLPVFSRRTPCLAGARGAVPGAHIGGFDPGAIHAEAITDKVVGARVDVSHRPTGEAAAFSIPRPALPIHGRAYSQPCRRDHVSKCVGRLSGRFLEPIR